MSALPQGWEEATLSDVAALEMGQSPAGEFTNIEGQGLPLIGGAADYSGGVLAPSRFTSAPTKICAPGDIILCIRATIGKSALADREYCLGRGVAGLRPNIDSDWLQWKFVESASALDAAGVGTTFRQIDKRTLQNWPISLPPLAEQRRIVAKIDSLTSKSRRARDHLDHIPRLVQKYKQAILAAAFRGDLTCEWREEQGLPEPRSVLLGDVAEGFNYGSAAKSAKEGRVPVLRMGNIQDGKLNWADLVFTDDAAEIEKYRLKEGDVLFNRTNSPALVGKTALFTGEREAIYAGYLIRVRCKSELLPAFLTYCLNAPNGRSYSWEVKTDGVSQSNINAKKLAAFRFDLPSTEEQAEIVRRIEAALSWINRITADATRARKLIDHLDQSLLAKAFKGELVPQDPTDEPASALLDRIRAERAAAPKAKPGRRKAA